MEAELGVRTVVGRWLLVLVAIGAAGPPASAASDPTVQDRAATRFDEVREGDSVTDREDAEVELPVLLRRTEVRYPKRLRHSRIEGVLTVVAVVRRDGRIGEVKMTDCRAHFMGSDLEPPTALGSCGSFLEAASKAVRRWRYRPATREGKPVAIYYTIRIEFRLR